MTMLLSFIVKQFSGNTQEELDQWVRGYKGKNGLPEWAEVKLNNREPEEPTVTVVDHTDEGANVTVFHGENIVYAVATRSLSDEQYLLTFMDMLGSTTVFMADWETGEEVELSDEEEHAFVQQLINCVPGYPGPVNSITYWKEHAIAPQSVSVDTSALVEVKVAKHLGMDEGAMKNYGELLGEKVNKKVNVERGEF